jgi:hypothetical protein
MKTVSSAPRNITPFGVTDRQSRFLATVMLHSGVFVGRQYAAFAGITHGQKVHDFIQRLRTHRFVAPIELGTTGGMKILHVHHKPLYAVKGNAPVAGDELPNGSRPGHRSGRRR